ncbi:MAG: hypothetical protein J0L66_06890 [Cytophagales bacterium]|nr:hypothetical protein [Cytophagales bacterium]
MKRLLFWLKVLGIQLVGFVAIIFYEGCCGDTSLPYVEVTAISLTTSNNLIGEQDTLKLNVLPADVRFLAKQSGFFQSAYALSCPMDGDGGPKYKYTKFEITSDNDFDTEHPEGAPLNAYFDLLVQYDKRIFNLATTEVDLLANMALDIGSIVRTTHRPAAPGTHTLSVKIDNEHGTQLLATLTVTWN